MCADVEVIEAHPKVRFGEFLAGDTVRLKAIDHWNAHWVKVDENGPPLVYDVCAEDNVSSVSFLSLLSLLFLSVYVCVRVCVVCVCV